MKMIDRHGALGFTLLGASLLAGCGDTIVLGGGEGGAGGGAATTSGDTMTSSVSTTGGVTVAGPGPSSNAVTTGNGSTGSSSGGQATLSARYNSPAAEADLCGAAFPCDPPDDAIIIVLDSAAPVCDFPLQRTYGSGAGWRVVIAIPPEKLAVGRYVLSENSDIVGNTGFELATSGITAAAGPSLQSGEIEIIAVDGLDLTIRTSGLTDGTTGTDGNGEPISFDSDGEYTAVPCQ